MEEPLYQQGPLIVDIAAHVFSFLGVSDKQTVAQVCRLWRDIVYRPSLWNEVTVVVPLKCSKVLVKSLSKRKITRLYCPRVTYDDLMLLFSVLPEISHLGFGGCPNVSQVFPKMELPQLEHLEHMRFSHCAPISIDRIFLKICGASLKKIKSLSLEDLTESGFKNLIKHLDNLETLNFSQCDMLEDGPLLDIAKCCPKLKQLRLHRCFGITSVGLQDLIENLLHLTSLNLSDTYVKHLPLEAIAKNLPNLTFLDLTRCKITSEEMSCIARNHPKLRHLAFTTPRESYQALELMFCQIAQLSELRCLMIGGLVDITDSSICKLVKNLPNLTSLDVGYGNRISDKTGELIGTYLQRLESLSLNSGKMSDKGVTVLFSKLKKLTSLHLHGCYITNDGMKRMASNLVHLKSLILSSPHLTDIGVKHLAMNLKGLTRLDLKNCCNLTNVGVHILAVNLPQLLQLNLSYCDGVFDPGGFFK